MSDAFLCLIVDVNPNWWGSLLETLSKEEQDASLAGILSIVSSFCNAYVLQDSRNHLLVLAAGDAIRNPILYAFDDAAGCQTDAGIAVRCGLEKLLNEQNERAAYTKESPLAGPISMALCRLNRVSKEFNENKNCRIMVLKLSDDTTNEHLNLMNMFFAAQKQNVLIDACLLKQDCVLMQQACDITGGIYLRVDHLGGLLQYLLMVFLPNADCRNKLLPLPSGNVDYRPACFCHNKFVSVGWVCSVCLSVFCQFSPICPTCQTVFKFFTPRQKTRKRKKTSN